MSDRQSPETEGINLYSESALHAALKAWYARPGDRMEVEVDGVVIDIVRDDLLIEIQTRNFSAIKPKLTQLVESHRVLLVHPIPAVRWIVKEAADGRRVERRRSPKKGHPAQVFSELVYIHHLMPHPNFSLEVVMIEEEELRRNDGKGSWRRRGWSIIDRALLMVNERCNLESPEDAARMLPDDLPESFTTADLARGLKQRRRVAQQMAYCLRHMGMIEVVGKAGRSQLYARVAAD